MRPRAAGGPRGREPASCRKRLFRGGARRNSSCRARRRWNRPRRCRPEGECASRSEEHTSELQSRQYIVCRLLLEKKKRLNSSCHPYRPYDYSATDSHLQHTTSLLSINYTAIDAPTSPLTT